MVERGDIRVSDRDRQHAADRLKAAMDEGRLDLFEYDERLAQAYRSATYAELDRLFHDLPPTARPVSTTPAPRPPQPIRPRPTGLPTALRVLWIVYPGVLVINLVAWTLNSLGNGEPDTFWPMWLLVPGVILAVVTLCVQQIRRG